MLSKKISNMEIKHKKGGAEEKGFGILNRQYLIKSPNEME